LRRAPWFLSGSIRSEADRRRPRKKRSPRMRFKTKDLLVTVLPKATLDVQDFAKICLLRTNICRSPSVCFSPTLCGTCSFHLSCLCTLQRTVIGCGGNSCGPGNSACDPTIFCAGGSQDPWVIQDL